MTRSLRRSPKRSDAGVQVRAAEIEGTIIRDRLEQLHGRESTSVTESINFTTKLVLQPGRTWTRRTAWHITTSGDRLEVLTGTVAEDRGLIPSWYTYTLLKSDVTGPLSWCDWFTLCDRSHGAKIFLKIVLTVFKAKYGGMFGCKMCTPQ